MIALQTLLVDPSSFSCSELPIYFPRCILRGSSTAGKSMGKSVVATLKYCTTNNATSKWFSTQQYRMILVQKTQISENFGAFLRRACTWLDLVRRMIKLLSVPIVVEVDGADPRPTVPVLFY